MSPFVLRGLYAISDTTQLQDTALVEACEAALLGGARVLQYRDKGHDPVRRRREALALVALCERYAIPLIVNDDLELAARVGAHGVHLGRDDVAIGEARARLGARAVIGRSCYDDAARAMQAAAAGADYVAFGSFFASPTKPHAVLADVALLREVRRHCPLPVVAIGGITPENGAPLVAAGADMLAVISGLFAAPDPRAAAARYAALFDSPVPQDHRP